ncbi:MAG TPA: PPK2 family polyphosphate kinase [Gemmatimonadaceae bacterium]|nr:PPK2 family polyphosphate kinase [Gemmatimonadaceae bacterium]
MPLSRLRLRPVSTRAVPRLIDAEARVPAPVPTEEELERETEKLVKRLTKLQRVFYADGRYALLIVLQGRDASGKDGTIRKVFGAVNPQGCVVHSFRAPNDVERQHDYLWRIHQRVPPTGMIGIFNRSQYEDILVPRVRRLVPPAVWRERYAHINDFERMLAANGVVIRKFMLHISRAEQKRRFKDRLNDPDKQWKFRRGDLDDRRHWRTFTGAYRDILRRTSTRWAPWYVVPADDKDVRNHLIARVLVETLGGLGLRYPEPDEDLDGITIE